MGIVSTGQITLYDHNDAAPISALISPSQKQGQVYTEEDGVTTYLPNWVSTPNVLTPYVYVRGENVHPVMTSHKWGTTIGASDLGTGATFSKNTNIPAASPAYQVFYQGTYTDPITRIAIVVQATILLTCQKNGTSGVSLEVDGQFVIEKVAEGTKNTALITANLVRGSSVDNVGTTYKWFVSPYAAADQLDANHALVTSGKITFKTTAGAAATNPADGTWADVKSIVISEDAIVDIGLFQVKAKDGAAIEFSRNFVVHDLSDPYELRILCNESEVFLNGVGTKNLIPEVWYGGGKVSSLSGYTFAWSLYDRFGKKSGFIDAAKTDALTARTITAHTALITGTFTHDGAALGLTAGQVIRVVSLDGLSIESYEIASVATNTITIRSALNGFSTTAPTANQFLNGKLYAYTGTGATAGVGSTSAGASMVVKDIDVDGTCAIYCTATKA